MLIDVDKWRSAMIVRHQRLSTAPQGSARSSLVSRGSDEDASKVVLLHDGMIIILWLECAA